MFNLGQIIKNAFYPAPAPPVPAPPSVVDCREKPYDLRPALNAIMAAENWILERIPPEQKLVIVIGENHIAQSHALLQSTLLKQHSQKMRAKNAPKFAYGMEYPSNFLQEYNKYTQAFGYPTDIERFHKESNLNGSMDHLKAMLNFIKMESAKNILELCLKEKIPTGFNDIAIARSYFNYGIMDPIDQTDSLTKNLVQEHYPHLAGKNIGRVEDPGINLRNLAMVENAMAHMEQTDSKVYIQHCGAHHIAGFDRIEETYTYSLTKLFQERGVAVLPVFLEFAATKEVLPDAAAESIPQSVRITGMDSARSYKMSFETAKRHICSASKLDL